jgi:hypothetical protein
MSNESDPVSEPAAPHVLFQRAPLRSFADKEQAAAGIVPRDEVKRLEQGEIVFDRVETADGSEQEIVWAITVQLANTLAIGKRLESCRIDSVPHQHHLIFTDADLFDQPAS